MTARPMVYSADRRALPAKSRKVIHFLEYEMDCAVRPLETRPTQEIVWQSCHSGVFALSLRFGSSL